MRKLKKIELRFRRRLALVPSTELFVTLAAYYLMIWMIHTNLDPYIDVASDAFMSATRQEKPTSWTEFSAP